MFLTWAKIAWEIAGANQVTASGVGTEMRVAKKVPNKILLSAKMQLGSPPCNIMNVSNLKSTLWQWARIAGQLVAAGRGFATHAAQTMLVAKKILEETLLSVKELLVLSQSTMNASRSVH